MRHSGHCVSWKELQGWINQAIPNSELEIFEAAIDGGHFTFIEPPETFIETFINRSNFMTQSF
ncbi:hypothetical protein H6F86_10345 [Phormidium sp. FACHB-592]|uniref:Alpha/beta hydrolase n=1 Tax=Stenomitos frigidus AS-A4 TaxID=2933935 RepID=A0ABV0KQ01_9CYAN|nr:hypothetical protein [Phormidium sp. FACHB-592]MBD2074282.1 hypothetical protein [Phormidium sp. FACHB-592]